MFNRIGFLLLFFLGCGQLLAMEEDQMSLEESSEEASLQGWVHVASANPGMLKTAKVGYEAWSLAEQCRVGNWDEILRDEYERLDENVQEAVENSEHILQLGEGLQVSKLAQFEQADNEIAQLIMEKSDKKNITPDKILAHRIF